jgi:hypothetical protein
MVKIWEKEEVRRRPVQVGERQAQVPPTLTHRLVRGSSTPPPHHQAKSLNWDERPRPIRGLANRGAQRSRCLRVSIWQPPNLTPVHLLRLLVCARNQRSFRGQTRHPTLPTPFVCSMLRSASRNIHRSLFWDILGFLLVEKRVIIEFSAVSDEPSTNTLSLFRNSQAAAGAVPAYCVSAQPHPTATQTIAGGNSLV